jgi:hypothetical protein
LRRSVTLIDGLFLPLFRSIQPAFCSPSVSVTLASIMYSSEPRIHSHR